MKNIEIKEVIDGKLAVVIRIDNNDFPLGKVNTYLNLDNILYFQTYKSKERNIPFCRETIENNDSKPTYVDGFPEDSDFFDYDNEYHGGWRVKIPENTPVISLFFPSRIVFNLYFLHHGEYKKIMRILTDKNS